MPTRDDAWPQGTPCWIDCQVDDTTKAREFYAGLFGWEIYDSPEEAGGYLMAMKHGKPAAGIGPKPQGCRCRRRGRPTSPRTPPTTPRPRSPPREVRP